MMPMVRVLQVRLQVMMPLVMPMVTVLQVMQRVMVPVVMQMSGVLLVMRRFLGTVMGTTTHQHRSLDCWETRQKEQHRRWWWSGVRVL